MSIKSELRAAYTQEIKNRRIQGLPLIYIDKGEHAEPIFYAAYLGRTDFIDSKAFTRSSLSLTTLFVEDSPEKPEKYYERYQTILERKDSQIFNREDINNYIPPDPNAKWFATPLQIAARMGHIEFVNRLLSEKTPLLAKGPGLGALHCAIRARNMDIVYNLIIVAKKRLSKNFYSFLNQGDRLFDFSYQSYTNLLPSDKTRGKYIHWRGLTPLSTAIILEEFEIAKILITAGANVNALNFLSPLRLAVISNNSELTKIILNRIKVPKFLQLDISDSEDLKQEDLSDSKKNLNREREEKIRDTKGERKIRLPESFSFGSSTFVMLITLLGEAMYNRNEGLALLLLDRGADYRGDCMLTASALMVAVMYKCPRVLKRLLDMGVPIDTALTGDRSNVANTMYTLPAQTAPDGTLHLPDPYYSMTPLIYAITHNADKCAELLINHGANLRVSSEKGTPIEAAVSNGNLSILTKILDKDITLLSDTYGSKPLYNKLLNIIEGKKAAVEEAYEQRVQEINAGNFLEMTRDREDEVPYNPRDNQKLKARLISDIGKSKNVALSKWKEMRKTLEAAKKALDKKNSDQV